MHQPKQLRRELKGSQAQLELASITNGDDQMCGIAGWVDFARQEPDSDRLESMTDMMWRRGPDDKGFVEYGPAHLGHRRLSIIDLASGGQPMTNEDDSIWIVFNGEIFNYQELRSNLKRQGHRFRTQSDTETIVHLYEQYGDKCVDHLRGQFAFAIWDMPKQRLLIARDRMGQKPLYYAQRPDRLFFASELKGLTVGLEESLEIDPYGLDAYLALGFIPDPLTIYRNVHKLPPAHIATFDHRGLSLSRYWSAPFGSPLRITEEESLERAHEIISEATRLRMLADVPLGAFLSGGIDSSLVVGHMSRHSNIPIKTFCIGFEESSHDERPYARQVAKRYQTDHQDFVVRANAIQVLPELVEAYDEPFADSSAIPTYYLSKFTREYVKVALNGDGGDESFAGYNRYAGTAQFAAYQNLPGWLHTTAYHSARLLCQLGFERVDAIRRLVTWNDYRRTSLPETYQRTLMFPTDTRFGLMSDDIVAALDSSRLGIVAAAMEHCPSKSPIDQMMFADHHVYLPGDLLVKVDRMTMWHSLEGRSPLLDHKLVAFAARLPTTIKFRKWDQKHLLKRLLRQEMPASFVNRRKMGFGVPLASWFRHQLKDYLLDTLSRSQIAGDGILKQSSIQSVIDQHMNRHSDRSRLLWSLLILENWYKTAISKRELNHV